MKNRISFILVVSAVFLLSLSSCGMMGKCSTCGDCSKNHEKSESCGDHKKHEEKSSCDCGK